MKSSGSSEPGHTSRRFRFWQLRLSTLLAIVLLSAVGMGWWSDHVRMAEELADVKLDAEMRFRQIQSFPRYPPLRRMSRSSRIIMMSEDLPFDWGPDDFISAVEREYDDGHISWGFESELANTNKVNFDATVQRLIPLMSSPQAHVRQNALSVLKGTFYFDHGRMRNHLSEFTDAAMKLFQQSSKGSDEQVRVLAALQEAGTNSSTSAVEMVTQVINDNEHPLAVQATLTVTEMDPTIEIGPRLKQLVEIRHPQWSTAAESLHHHLPDEEVYEFLKREYAQAKTENDKQTLVRALNKLDL